MLNNWYCWHYWQYTLGGWLRDIYTTKQTCSIIPSLCLALCVVWAIDNRSYWSTHHGWSTVLLFSLNPQIKKSCGQSWGAWSVKGLPYKQTKLAWNPRTHTRSACRCGWNFLGRQRSAGLWVHWPMSLDCLTSSRSVRNLVSKQGGCNLRDDTWGCSLASTQVHTHMNVELYLHTYCTWVCVHTYAHKKMSNMSDISQGSVPFHSHVWSLQITHAYTPKVL